MQKYLVITRIDNQSGRARRVYKERLLPGSPVFEEAAVNVIASISAQRHGITPTRMREAVVREHGCFGDCVTFADDDGGYVAVGITE